MNSDARVLLALYDFILTPYVYFMVSDEKKQNDRQTLLLISP